MEAASGTSWRRRGLMVSAPRNIVSSVPRARSSRSVKTWPRSRAAARRTSATAARARGGELDLVHGQELDPAVEGHRLHRAHEVARGGGNDPLLARDEGDGV